MPSQSLSISEFSELVESTLTWPTPALLALSPARVKASAMKAPTRPLRILSTLKRRASSVFVSRPSEQRGRDRSTSLPEVPPTLLPSFAPHVPWVYAIESQLKPGNDVPSPTSSSSSDWPSPPHTPSSALPVTYEDTSSNVKLTKWDASFDDPFAKDGVQVVWEPNPSTSRRGSNRSTTLPQAESFTYLQKPLPPTPIPSPVDESPLDLSQYRFPLPLSPPLPTPFTSADVTPDCSGALRIPLVVEPSSSTSMVIIPPRRRSASIPERAKKPRRPTTPMSELMKHWPPRQQKPETVDWTLNLPGDFPPSISAPPSAYYTRRYSLSSDNIPAPISPRSRASSSRSRRTSTLEREFGAFLKEAGDMDVFPELAAQEEVWDARHDEGGIPCTMSLEDLEKWRRETRDAVDDGLFYASRASLIL